MCYYSINHKEKHNTQLGFTLEKTLLSEKQTAYLGLFLVISPNAGFLHFEASDGVLTMND